MSPGTAPTSNPTTPKEPEELFLFQSPWTFLYLAICIVISIAIALLIFLPLGFSAASDRVFGLEVMIAGIIGDILFRKILRRRMMLLRGLKVPAIFAWPVIGVALVLGALVLSPPKPTVSQGPAPATGLTQKVPTNRNEEVTQPRSTSMEEVATTRICSETTAEETVQLITVAFVFPTRFREAVEERWFGNSPDQLSACVRLLARIGMARVVAAAPDGPSIRQLATERATEIAAQGGPDLRSQVGTGFGDYSAIGAVYLEEIADFYPDAYNGDWSAAGQSQYAQFVNMDALLNQAMDPESQRWYTELVSKTIDDYTPTLVQGIMQAEDLQNGRRTDLIP